MDIKERLTFLKSFLKDVKVASVTPSSIHSVKRVCKKIDFRKDLVVVEYGPGTGVFSRYILDRMNKKSKLILIETNEKFYHELKQIKDPRLSVYLDSAENVLDILEQNNITNADYIISGIPFSYLSKEQKSNLLYNTYTALKDNGVFLMYQFISLVKGSLTRYFSKVKYDFEILNIPPLFIFEAIKYKN